MIISGSLTSAGEVSANSLKVNDSNDTKNPNNNISRTRPTLTNASLSKFLLHQHGGDETNGHSDTEIISTLTDAIRLMDIDIDDAIYTAAPQGVLPSTATSRHSHQASRFSTGAGATIGTISPNHTINPLDDDHFENDSNGLSLLKQLFIGVKQLKEYQFSKSNEMVILGIGHLLGHFTHNTCTLTLCQFG